MKVFIEKHLFKYHNFVLNRSKSSKKLIKITALKTTSMTDLPDEKRPEIWAFQICDMYTKRKYIIKINRTISIFREFDHLNVETIV